MPRTSTAARNNLSDNRQSRVGVVENHSLKSQQVNLGPCSTDLIRTTKIIQNIHDPVLKTEMDKHQNWWENGLERTQQPSKPNDPGGPDLGLQKSSNHHDQVTDVIEK